MQDDLLQYSNTQVEFKRERQLSATRRNYRVKLIATAAHYLLALASSNSKRRCAVIYSIWCGVWYAFDCCTDRPYIARAAYAQDAAGTIHLHCLFSKQPEIWSLLTFAKRSRFEFYLEEGPQ